MSETVRFQVEDMKPYVLRMPCSEAMMSLGQHGHLHLLRVRFTDNPYYPVIEFPRRWFYNRPPNKNGDRWDYSGHNATLEELLAAPEKIEWHDSGYTYSEVGLYMDPETGLYGYLPDMTERAEEIQKVARECQTLLHAIFLNAEAKRL